MCYFVVDQLRLHQLMHQGLARLKRGAIIGKRRLTLLLRLYATLSDLKKPTVSISSASMAGAKVVASSSFRHPFGIISHDAAAYIRITCKTQAPLVAPNAQASWAESFIAQLQVEDIDDLIPEIPASMLDLFFGQINGEYYRDPSIARMEIKELNLLQRRNCQTSARLSWIEMLPRQPQWRCSLLCSARDCSRSQSQLECSFQRCV